MKFLTPFVLFLGLLRVSTAAPIGPMVLSSAPTAMMGTPASNIRFVFDRSVDLATFTSSDIVSFTGPGGSISITGINPVPASGNQQFDVVFATQSVAGAYSMTIGPDIRDLPGNQMDQNGNGIAGEIPGDRYAAAFSIFGPSIVSSLPSGTVSSAVSSLRVAFDRSIDPTTFTFSDIISFLGPGGAILPTTFSPVSGTSNQQFDIGFTSQTAPGLYSMTIGPDVLDTFGNRMDQNRNGITGEVPGDRYLAAFAIAGVPEPATVFLFACGLLLFVRRPARHTDC